MFLRTAASVVTLLDVGGRRGGCQCRRDLGLGQLAAQIGGHGRRGRNRREVLPSHAAVVDHQAAVGRNDISGPQGRIVLDRCIDQPERGSAIAGAAVDQLFPIGESRAQVGVAPAVRCDRLIDAGAAVDLGPGGRAERAAGLLRRRALMSLNGKKAPVAQPHAIGDRGVHQGLKRLRPRRAEQVPGGERIGIGAHRRRRGSRRRGTTAQDSIENPVLGRSGAAREQKHQDRNVGEQNCVGDACAHATGQAFTAMHQHRSVPLGARSSARSNISGVKAVMPPRLPCCWSRQPAKRFTISWRYRRRKRPPNAQSPQK